MAAVNHSVSPMDIRILREPTIYLVGRQTVDEGELDRFLADHGVTPHQDDRPIVADCDGSPGPTMGYTSMNFRDGADPDQA